MQYANQPIYLNKTLFLTGVILYIIILYKTKTYLYTSIMDIIQYYVVCS